MAELLIEQRVELYGGYTVYLIAMQALVTDEEWTPIMKAFNKLLE